MPKKITQEEYIKMCEKLYGDKYDHSLVQYANMRSDITVICKEHGPFKQNASSHLRWGGCPKCSAKTIAALNTFSTEQFIEKAKAIHGEKYDYSKVDYKGNKKHVEIICNKCGKSFSQTPNVHLRSPNSCPYCWESKRNAHFATLAPKKN